MSLRPLLGAAVAAGTLLLSAVPAAAHAELKSADPADGATLATAPDRLTLTFTEGASVTKSSVSLGGTALPLTQPAGHPDVLLADLRAAAPHGPVTVTWRSVSSDDGHVATGTLHYRIGATSPATAEQAITHPGANSGALLYGGVLGLLCLGFGCVVLANVRRARRDDEP